MAGVVLLSRSTRPCVSMHGHAWKFSEQMIASIIYDSRCEMSDVAFRTALSCLHLRVCVRDNDDDDGSPRKFALANFKSSNCHQRLLGWTAKADRKEWVRCCFTALQQLGSLAPGCSRQIARCKQFKVLPRTTDRKENHAAVKLLIPVKRRQIQQNVVLRDIGKWLVGFRLVEILTP